MLQSGVDINGIKNKKTIEEINKDKSYFCLGKKNS